jgi:hypothetical protein
LLDIFTTWTTSNFTSSQTATSTGTLNHANELVIGYNAIDTFHTAATPVCGGSFTLMGTETPTQGSGAPNLWPCGLVVSATTAQAPSESWTTSTGAETAAFSLVQASGAPSATYGVRGLMGIGQ